MEIAKNKTTLTKKMLFAFQNREIFKKSWVILICALALIVVSFRIVDGKLVLNSIPFLVIGCLAYPLYIGILELFFIKQNKTFTTVTIEYTFQTDSIQLNGTSAYGKETSELFYSKLEKIVFTKKYIYIYINKTSALLVDTSSFSSGSPEKIRALLEYSYADKVKGFKRKEKKATKAVLPMDPKRYSEIFNKIKDFLPEKWEKVALYFLFSGNMVSHEFYVDSGEGYVSCFNMEYDDSCVNKIFDSIEKILMEERAKLPKTKRWSVFTMFVDKSGKFDVRFDYGKMLNKFIKYQKKWEDKHIWPKESK